ncbi:ECF-type sigma factor [Parahaliea mediterranea]|uniref:RNA polymerase sigma-70 ECF-like HTH domain-containing protein n=1 Tax=Parahaliea mediterranea TaxID=651086 RepID=A0A939DGP8_9GAMM|nr:ECF-type sigma factor [Parahaliea mediterranea]MBN7797754.1 hypothetical protein [Parahaliea mediterranea]
MGAEEPVTTLLKQWRAGSDAALDQLTPLVYEELRKRARAAFRSEQAGHTLQPTALVHELFGRLSPIDVDWRDRSHFYALCSRMMRRILVDHAKARAAAKRGGGNRQLTLSVALASESAAETPNHEDLLSLDRALNQLSELDQRKADLLDLQIFGGLSFRELEEVTGLSSSTLDRDLRFARSWLKAQLSAGQ